MQPNEMNTNRIILIALIAGAILLIGGLAWWFSKGGDGEMVLPGEQRGVAGDPVDVVLDFYEEWLSARQSTSTNPFAEGLTNSMALSVELSGRLATSEGTLAEGALDPVLCQTAIPEKLRAQTIYMRDTDAQMLILSRDKQAGRQAVVTVAAHDGLWEITDISCSAGEEAPEQGEFSFDKEGRLLKSSVPPPLDPQHWHLVFEEAGVFGHTAPLFLSEGSMCITEGGAGEACRDDMFSETMLVRVQGEMTEAGVDVKRVEILE